MEETLAIQDLSPRGYGVARWQKNKIEIAHAIPGDTVLADCNLRRNRPAKGRILSILSPSPDRVEPRCAHASLCGGCCWQQMDYNAQLRYKQAFVEATFGSPVQPILSAPSPWRYRNKMEFSFSENRAGTKFLGLMIAQAEPYVFNVEHCHLTNPWMSEVLRTVRDWWSQSALPAYNGRDNSGLLRYLTLREGMRTGQKMAILNTSASLDTEGFVDAVRSALPGEEPSIFLRIHRTLKGTPTDFSEEHLSGPTFIIEELRLSDRTLSFAISPSSFFQPNTLQAEVLYDTAMRLLAPAPSNLLFDLYAGTGTLAMAFASRVAKVVAVELNSQSVLDGQNNAQRNNITNVTFHAGDVGNILTKIGQQPDAVIVDPPRAGLDPQAVQQLIRLSPQKILYIACNPLTQTENCQELLAAGYSLAAIQPVDQFPHTYHIENIVLLVKN